MCIDFYSILSQKKLLQIPCGIADASKIVFDIFDYFP